MLTLFDPRMWGVLLVGLVLAFGAGYATKAHYAAVELAEAEARQKTLVQTVEKVVTVTDNRQVQVLKNKLKSAEARAASLQTMISEEAHANPASVDCRVSDRLRDEINRDLAADPQ